jgi:hypothetical protein
VPAEIRPKPAAIVGELMLKYAGIARGAVAEFAILAPAGK